MSGLQHTNFELLGGCTTQPVTHGSRVSNPEPGRQGEPPTLSYIRSVPYRVPSSPLSGTGLGGVGKGQGTQRALLRDSLDLPHLASLFLLPSQHPQS